MLRILDHGKEVGSHEFYGWPDNMQYIRSRWSLLKLAYVATPARLQFCMSA
jgi:hypothetical protein